MKQDWKSSVVWTGVIVLMTVVVYIPALRGNFVWDDNNLIVENPMVGAHDGLYRFWCTTEAPDYYPLTWSLWWLEWRAFGKNAMGYHIVNVLLHAINAVLVWIVLRKLRIPGAWLAGLLFALHPVNVATVAWISEQKNTLSMLFYSVAILLYLRFDANNRWRWYGLAFAAFLLALLSKTAVVMLPVVLLGCVWWLHGRLRWKDVLLSVPFLALSLGLGLVTVWFQHHRALEGFSVRTVSLAARLAGAGWVPWFYLYKALLPINLALIYPKWNIDGSSWVSYLPGAILAGCFIVFWRDRKTWGRPLLFGLSYFVIMLFPVLGFFDQGFYVYSLVADHWQYVAIIAPIAWATGAGVAIGQREFKRNRYVLGLASATVMAWLAVAVWTRCRTYQDNERLWRDAVAQNPQAWLAHYNLGVALAQAGRFEDAIPHYEQALRVRPDFADIHNNLGVALRRIGRVDAAIGQYQQALRIKPDFAEAHNNLGLALAQQGKLDEAIAQYQQAVQIKPDDADAHWNLGCALLQSGKAEEAIPHLQWRLRTNPDDAPVLSKLGTALTVVGRVHEAMAYFDRGLRLAPDNAETQNNLAWLLATLPPTQGGNPVRAVALAQRACEHTGNRVAEYLDTLAAAYAAAGRFDDAVVTVEKAIVQARSVGQLQSVPGMEARLRLYRDRQPAPNPNPRNP